MNRKRLGFFASPLHELNDDVQCCTIVNWCNWHLNEGGEYAEIVKKCVFRKPMDDDTHPIKRELGDIIWYWVNPAERWVLILTK